MRIAALILIFVSSISIAQDKDSEWDQQIDQYLEAYKKTAADPAPTAYPKLGERVKNVFCSFKMNRLVIKREVDKKVKVETELYYGNGELFIFRHEDGWNMFTKGEYVYEWQSGKKTGIRMKKSTEDLVDYILYITDPSYLWAALYSDYTEHPERFKVIEHEGKAWKELALKKPIIGIEALFVNEKSLWFHGVRANNPESGVTTTTYYEKPVKYDVLPKRLLKAMKQISFSDSDQTIGRHMVYL